MGKHAQSAELDLNSSAMFREAQPLQKGRRFTLLRRSPKSVPLDRVIVFVHGLWSSAATWDPFVEAAFDSAELDQYDFAAFEYQTSHINRIVPFIRKIDAGHWARILADTVEHSLLSRNRYRSVVLVGHSMGGLVSKIAIQELVESRNLSTVEKIHSVFTYGTPHYGSDRAPLLLSLLSSDIAFLRRHGDAINRLRKFWTAHVGADKPLMIHERAVVSAKDEVVPMSSAEGGLSQAHIFNIATSHVQIHCPENAADRRITWFAQELAAIDRVSSTRLIEIRDMPSVDGYMEGGQRFLQELNSSVFVLDVGSSDGVESGDEFQIFYDNPPVTRPSGLQLDQPPRQWSKLKATRVTENITYASLSELSTEAAFEQMELLQDELGLSRGARPSRNELANLVTALFGKDAGRIARDETDAARPIIDAEHRAQDETPGSEVYVRALHEIVDGFEAFYARWPDSPLVESLHFKEALAHKKLGSLGLAQQRFEAFLNAYPFSAGVPGARYYCDEIRLRQQLEREPTDDAAVLRLGEFLFVKGDSVEGIGLLHSVLDDAPDQLSKLHHETRLDLFASLVTYELLQLRFADRADFGRWLDVYVRDEAQQASMRETIEAVGDTVRRRLLLRLWEGICRDWRSVTKTR